MTNPNEPAAAKQAAALAKTNADALAPWLRFEVRTDDDAALAVREAASIKAQRVGLETMRDGWAKPLRDVASSITRTFKPAIDQLDAIERHLKGAATQHEVRKSEAQRVALAVAAQTQRPEDVARAVAITTPRPQGLQVRDHWVAEVTDETKIPRRFWILDTTALNKLATEHRGNLSAVVPGVQGVNRPVGALV